MRGRYRPPRPDRSTGVLGWGAFGVALLLGGLAVGGDWGLGLLLVGTAVTVWGVVLFARAAVAHRRGRRQ